MSSKEVEFLVKLRDGAQLIADAANEYLETFAPKDRAVTVAENVFTVLKFEAQQGAKIGAYEVAYKTTNDAEKWTLAFNILKDADATIKDRYHGTNYEFSYWLYGEKIYRQKMKPKT